MSGKLRDLLLFLGILLLIFGAGFLVGRRSRGNARNLPASAIPDTVTILDAIVDYRPKETAIPAGFELVSADTLRVHDAELSAYKDSMRRKPMLVEVHDTTYIAVPMSRTTFTDGKTYKCEVMGYNTKMLWHESYQETRIINTPVVVSPAFAISPVLSAFGIGKVFGIGAGVEVYLRQGNWAFRPSVGYGLNNDGQNWGHGMYLRFDATYNLYRK